MEESAEMKHSYAIKKCQEYDIGVHTYSPIGGRKEEGGQEFEDGSLALEEGDDIDTTTTCGTNDNDTRLDTRPSPFMRNAFTIDDETVDNTVESANVRNNNNNNNNKDYSKSWNAVDDDDELL
eukprot:scaffold4466_cov130-Amphora_coffeaeformis.AAC.2